MVPRSRLPFTLRNILDQVSLTSPAQRTRPIRGICLNRWQRIFAVLGYWWWADSNVAWRNEIPLHGRPERFLNFCRECGEETPHEGFDEYGAGWYAQICRCRHCGEQGMRVWPLAWW